MIYKAMKLKLFMKENDLTVEAFASISGFSRGAILKWISGDRFPRPLALKRIKELTNNLVTPNYFETK